MKIFSRLVKSIPRSIKVRTFDTLLDAERAPPADMGRTWIGDFRMAEHALATLKSAIGGITDEASRKRVASAAIRDLSGLCGSSSPSSSDTPEFKLDREVALGSDPQFDDQPNVSLGASPADINDANANFWNPRKTSDRAAPLGPRASVQDHMDKFWADRTGKARPMTGRDMARYSAALNSTSMPTRIAAINAMNEKFYNKA